MSTPARAAACFVTLLCTAALALGGRRDSGGASAPSFGSAPAQASSAKARPAQRLLLTIGVSQYQDSRWKGLQFADKDAQDLYTRLRDSYDALPPVTSDRYPGTGVTLATLRQQLTLLKMQNVREDDVVVVYFSGHGTLAKSLDPGLPLGLGQYLITSDTQYDRVRETALPRTELLEWFNSLKSKRKALVLDACFSGEGKGQWTSYVQQIVGRNKGNAGPETADELAEGAAVYSASSWGLPAEENPGLRNGVYTHFLIKGFGEDFDGDGAVRLSEAHLYALDAVEQYTQKRQRPTVSMEITGKDPVVVSGEETRAGRPMLFAWSSAERGLKVMIDNVRQKAMTKGSLDLPPGRRRLTLVDPVTGKPVFDSIVHFKEDTSYNLSNFLYPSQPHNVVLAAEAFLVPEKEMREQALPAVMPGTRLSYFTENLVDFADVQASYAYYFAKEHDVRRDVRLRSVDVGGLQDSRERQVSSMHSFDLGLLRRSPLPTLSLRDRSAVTEWYARGSLGALNVRRKSDLFESRAVTNWLPGGEVGLGVSTALPGQHVRFLLEGALGVWRNTLDVGSALFLSSRVSLGIGGFW